MAQDLDRSIIRILDAEGKTHGTGFFIAQGLAVTCAHVAARACGHKDTDAGLARGEKINVECYWNGQQCQAMVDPDRLSPVDQEDVAFLVFDTPPNDAQVLRMGSTKGINGHAFQTLGFAKPAFSPVFDVQSQGAYGVIVTPVQVRGKHDMLQVDGDEIVNGMSGAPIHDTTIDLVVGMVAGGVEGKYGRQVYVTTADTIFWFWPKMRLEASQTTRMKEPTFDKDPAPKADEKKKPPARKIIGVTAVIGGVIFVIFTLLNRAIPIPPFSAAPTATPGAPSTVTVPPPIPPTATVTPWPTKAAASTLTATPTPLTSCSFTGATDFETISSLIKAEASASVTKDKEVIHAIFDRNADFYDYNVPKGKQAKFWPNPKSRYDDDLFIHTTFESVSHYDIQQVGSRNDPKVAYFVSGSRGVFSPDSPQPTFVNGGKRTPPATLYGSDHWTLKKNAQDCWVITEFDFNAGHIPFPNP